MLQQAEQRAYQLAGRQAGYITRRQAIASGMSADAVMRRIRGNHWTRVKAGLYLIPGFDLTWRGQLLAATAALGAVVSHESAAELHRLPGVKREVKAVTVRTRTTNRFPNVIVHQSTDLSSGYIIEIEGLPATDVVRTITDLAATLGTRTIGRLVDHVVVNKLAPLDAFITIVGDLSRRGKPGMKTMHQVLELRTGEAFLGDSELELFVLRCFVRWGFPEPILQYSLPWRTPRRGRADFAFPELRLIIEVDGRKWHTTMDAFEEDRLRDNLAQLAGWRVIRITYRMLIDRPEEVRRMVAQALAA
ncbi:MAG TPA: type IV toxin-antitoxin system AbiEi family antitoxin domain-containing protein [Acidimicrobiia bacterium]|nr:type IV toxin-antitoxin system AbiEi family antitoxin domain-containing protein [Acidimicrobiia bacterium]